MVRNYQEIINIISDKFNNSLSQLDIISWLENFEKRDWEKALTVLNNFEYYSTRDIIREYDNGLKSIIGSEPIKCKIFLIPVGRIGKSGSAMIYYLKKTPSFTTGKFSIIENSDLSHLPENCKIVFVDDFSGTGDSILENYLKLKCKFPKNHTVIALTVAFMEKAKDKLEGYNIQILGNKRAPAFSDRGSVFGYYPKMKAIREFCFKYGNDLYPINDFENKKSRQHPLGYLNTQALIGFEHSIPNNTIPIIWANCKNKRTGVLWFPVFPRRGQLIIERSKEFKQKQRYWVSVVYKLGLKDSLFYDEEKYSIKTIQLITILYLKRKQKTDFSICQLLELSINEYESIIDIGKQKKLFGSKGLLTEQAVNIIEEIRRSNKFQQSKQTGYKLKIEEDLIYIPKIFRGSP